MAIKFDSINAGDVLYDCHRQKMGNTNMSQLGTWQVRVIEVDAEKRRALCSWNTNPATWWSEKRLSRLRRKRPEPRK